MKDRITYAPTIVLTQTHSLYFQVPTPSNRPVCAGVRTQPTSNPTHTAEGGLPQNSLRLALTRTSLEQLEKIPYKSATKATMDAESIRQSSGSPGHSHHCGTPVLCPPAPGPRFGSEMFARARVCVDSIYSFYTSPLAFIEICSAILRFKFLINLLSNIKNV